MMHKAIGSLVVTVAVIAATQTPGTATADTVTLAVRVVAAVGWTGDDVTASGVNTQTTVTTDYDGTEIAAVS